ncbi:MAG: hypothetical protein LBC56_07960 [Oscillospiraceae bacterium]|jgi:flavodoxin|nr:hypothetical protein [Oscillospiraceae bacterium]
MKTIVIFYSYTGHAKALAQKAAEKESADIAEIRDLRRPSKFRAFALGCFAAVRGKSWPIQPLGTDLAAYDRLILFSPIWAGNTPPAVNALLEQVPENKTVLVKAVSASGSSACKERIEAVIKPRGGHLESFENIKS